MGSSHCTELYKMLELQSHKSATYITNIQQHKFDDVWILPHFEHAIDYYKFKFNKYDIKVCPFNWEPDYLKINTNDLKPIHDPLSNCINIDIGVFEPNLFLEKNCFFPIIACEFAKRLWLLTQLEFLIL